MKKAAQFSTFGAMRILCTYWFPSHKSTRNNTFSNISLHLLHSILTLSHYMNLDDGKLTVM